MSFDVSVVKKDFPLLSREENGEPLIYLDSAATSQKPQKVLEVVDSYYREINANVHRGAYRLAEQATTAMDEIYLNRQVITKYTLSRVKK